MSILVDADTRVLVQGITGRIGRTQTSYMLRAGTRIVAGVTPGKGGDRVEGVPVYDTVREAVREPVPGAGQRSGGEALRGSVLGVDGKPGGEPAPTASVLFVPPAAAAESVAEAVSAGMRLLVLITEHIPVHDAMAMKALAAREGAMLIGPTTPGIITPRLCKLGILPANMFCPGPVGIVSRSGTLSYEVAADLCARGIGQSTVVGMGADMVVGTDLADIVALFNADRETHLVVIIGEVGGSQEEAAAGYIKAHVHKPVVAYIAGASAPRGRRMGHAGAIVEGSRGSVESKTEALRAAGVRVADALHDIPGTVAELLAQD